MDNQQRINVLFVLASLHRAGAETQLVDLVNNLNNQQFNKHLFTFEQNLDQIDRLDSQHIKFYNQPRRFKLDLIPIQQIARLIDSQEIEVIHCTQQFSLLLAWLGRFLSRRKPPIVTAIHSTYTYSIKEKIQGWLLYQHMLKFCTSDIIFVCKNQCDRWLKKYPSLSGHAHVVYNGIDTHSFNPDRWKNEALALKEQLNIPKGATVLSCIASFRALKGHSLLIQAFTSCNNQTYLVLAGDGQTRPDIEKQVVQLKMQHRVKFLGNIEDVRPLLAMSDLTVLPSTAETFSMAMLESLSMEVPLLATDVGGSSEAVIPGKTGELVEPGSVTDLKKGLVEVLKQPAALKEMGRNGRSLVIKYFTRDIMVSNTAKVLQNSKKIINNPAIDKLQDSA